MSSLLPIRNTSPFPTASSLVADCPLQVSFDVKDVRRIAFFTGVDVVSTVISSVASELDKTVGFSTRVAVRATSLFRDATAAKNSAEVIFKQVFQTESPSSSFLTNSTEELSLAFKNADAAACNAIEAAYEASYFSRAANRAYFRARDSFKYLCDTSGIAASDPAIAVEGSGDQASSVLDVISAARNQLKTIEGDASRVSSMAKRAIDAAVATVAFAAEATYMFYFVDFIANSRHEDELGEAPGSAKERVCASVDKTLIAANLAFASADLCDSQARRTFDAFKSVFIDRAFDYHDIVRFVSESSEAINYVLNVAAEVDEQTEIADSSFLRATFSLVQNKAASIVAGWVTLPDDDRGQAIARVASQALCSDEILRAQVDKAFKASKTAIKADQEAVLAIDKASCVALISVAVAADAAAAIAEAVCDVSDAALAKIKSRDPLV